ncbi:MAG: hypothetical protein KZQ66_20350 [Candidatus Thiodiazotropha sp. (ex Lucinoma aequizonata)]|nr:hypothetical protein [Candidatus Thiodiazotropha sp. (ex Lucinoma aequizonata)]MCU7899043.1 hypothetical protein [Candidatus Thiodiazotropha sp. (ex Lucinoma aequizonata)]MCU7904040.1 hypothetical protein [Candidatus Thiodiazotropha sp. (ex Lucinoma aequizonata)]MCU7909900.1 hypothetical protein [Candidatus Thiodiazotropha sp. (ex Lucinoma aequizonata)]MCU7911150.1 hypothetical protein [Candidatus Thiodiazotropha sp. (ex Lucinoma aequizonata)]
MNEYFTSFLLQRIPSLFLVFLSPFQGLRSAFHGGQRRYSLQQKRSEIFVHYPT